MVLGAIGHNHGPFQLQSAQEPLEIGTFLEVAILSDYI